MITKEQLMERLETIRDNMDTDFMNRYALEGVVKDINKLMNDVDNEIGSVYTDVGEA